MNYDVFYYLIVWRHKLNSLPWRCVKQKWQTIKVTIALVQYTLIRAPIEFQLSYHGFTSGSGLRPKPWSGRGKKWNMRVTDLFGSEDRRADKKPHHSKRTNNGNRPKNQGVDIGSAFAQWPVYDRIQWTGRTLVLF